MSNAAGISKILTLVFTDLADSTALKMERGDQAVGELIARHRAHVRRLAADAGGRIVDWAGDGCFLTFETPSAAVLFALRLQQVHQEELDLPSVRTGIHMGEVTERPGPDRDDAHPRVEGLAVDLAARISGLARPGQVLMSAAVSDSSRPRLRVDALGQRILWRAYGTYALKGFDKALEISEAGLEGSAPLAAPAASDKAAPVASAAGRFTASTSVRTRSRRLSVAILFLLVLGIAAASLWRALAPRRSTLAPEGGPGSTGVGIEHADPLSVPGFGGRPAIAVLPFDNLSADPEQEYFADGLAEDLITRLSLWRSFPVIARNSSFVYKGKAVDVKRVSAELGVRYVVEGSVRKAGERIRVSAQLIDATTGQHVWAQTYDRELADVFALQDEISSTIAASMVGDMEQVESERALRQEPRNLAAWDLLQRALWHLDRGTAEENAQARTLLEQAVDLDPHFAAALAYLSFAHYTDIIYQWTDAPQTSIDAMLRAARRSVALDPKDFHAQASLAAALSLTGEREAMRAAAERAVDVNPSALLAHMWLAYALCGSTRTADESVTIVAKAMRLSPRDRWAWAFYDALACAHQTMARYEEAIDALRRIPQLRPNYPWGYLYLANSYAHLDRADEARAALREGLRLQPELSVELIRRALSCQDPEVVERFVAGLRKAGWDG
jgi:TolB-like protein/class 3 adenylate cyclase/Flp pilus assembly protein TadD